MKYCAQCRSCEREHPADYKVRGYIRDYYSDRKIPYRAFICDEHLEILTQNGAELTIEEYLNRPVTETRKTERETEETRVEKVLRKYTGYYSVNEFLQGNPTIRPGTFPGAELLREYYKEKTGNYPCS